MNLCYGHRASRGRDLRLPFTRCQESVIFAGVSFSCPSLAARTFSYNSRRSLMIYFKRAIDLRHKRSRTAAASDSVLRIPILLASSFWVARTLRSLSRTYHSVCRSLKLLRRSSDAVHDLPDSSCASRDSTVSYDTAPSESTFFRKNPHSP